MYSQIRILFFSLLATLASPTVFGASTQELLKVSGGKNSASADTNISLKDNFIKTIQVYLVSAYGIIAVGVLIYTGFKLFNAQGNPEEFKKAWIALLYVGIGLAIAPMAYVVVRIVLGFTIS